MVGLKKHDCGSVMLDISIEKCVPNVPVSSLPGQDDGSLSSEEEAEMSEPTWLAADLGAASDLSPPSRGERMRHSPQNTHSKEDDGKFPVEVNVPAYLVMLLMDFGSSL